jgi:hypothetical protein
LVAGGAQASARWLSEGKIKKLARRVNLRSRNTCQGAADRPAALREGRVTVTEAWPPMVRLRDCAWTMLCG